MRPLFLHLDGALDSQTALLAAGRFRRLAAHDLGPDLRLWAVTGSMEALVSRLMHHFPAVTPDLIFAGSRDFHHITPALVERALAVPGAGPVTVIHFGAEPAWERGAARLSRRNWARHAAGNPLVDRVISVGVREARTGDLARRADEDLIHAGKVEAYPFRLASGEMALEAGGLQWPTLEALGFAAFADLLASRIRTNAVYVTIDKAVLSNWEPAAGEAHGGFGLRALERLMRATIAGRWMIGADVVGDWSRARFGPDLISGLAKRAEAWTNRARRPEGDRELQRLADETTNLRLLRMFCERLQPQHPRLVAGERRTA